VYSRLAELAGSYYIKSDVNDWTLRPGYKGLMPSMENPGAVASVSINSKGFRGPDFYDESDKIIVLGDSYTFGVYVNDAETFTHHLNQLSLDDKKSDIFINAGFTGGLEIDQHFVWLHANLDKIKPRKLIYASFPPNDIMGISRDSWVQVGQDGLPKIWESKNLEVNEKGYIDNDDPSHKSLLNLIHDVHVLRESHFAVAVARVFDILTQKKPDHSLGYMFLYGLEQPGFAEKEQLYFNLLEGMRRLCQDRGVEFQVVLLPINFQVEPETRDMFFSGMERFNDMEPTYYSDLENRLKLLGYDVLNIERAMKASGEGPFFHKNGEPHFNSTGHRFVGKTVYQWLKDKK